jgi:uncharacterized membrane protein YkvA (DUF1232 family)
MPKGVRIALAIVIGVVTLAYGVSPVDLIPEIFTGPLGFLDDGAAVIAAVFGIWKLLSGGRGDKNTGNAEPTRPV